MSNKMTFFVGTHDDGYEPSEGVLTITDGTMNSIGHLFAASIINGEPAPAFLASSVYEYISSGIKTALKSAPKMDDTSNLGYMYQTRSFKILLSGSFRVRMRRICFQFRFIFLKNYLPKILTTTKRKAKSKSLKLPSSNPCVI